MQAGPRLRVDAASPSMHRAAGCELAKQTEGAMSGSVQQQAEILDISAVSEMWTDETNPEQL